MKQAVGIGAGGHAKVVIDILQLTGEFEVVGLVDRNIDLWGTDVLGIPVLGGDDMLPKVYERGVREAFIGVGSIGDTRSRRRLYEMVRRHGFRVTRAIHPQAVIAPSADIGHGATVLANAVINPGAHLGDNVLVNTAAVVEHDCVLEDHVHIATGAHLAGGVHVGEGSLVGIGAAVRQDICIGRFSVVGAGTVLVRDVPENVVVIGVPGRILKKVEK